MRDALRACVCSPERMKPQMLRDRCARWTVDRGQLRPGGRDRRAWPFLAQFRCEDQSLRVAASQSILAQALALALLTRRSATLGEEKTLGISTAALRFGALGLGVLAVIANGWSYFDPSLMAAVRADDGGRHGLQRDGASSTAWDS